MSDSFQILYANYYKRVFITCNLILKNSHLAEEACNEAFLKAYENIHTLKKPDKFGAWITAIATNISISLYNQNKKTFIAEEQEIDNLLLKQSHFNNDICLYVENMETNLEIQAAIQELDPPLNKIIFLKYFWGLKEAEIAKILDMPIGTVKTSTLRAKQKLFKILPTNNKDYLSRVKGGV